MKIAIYVRVSTRRQQQTQKPETSSAFRPENRPNGAGSIGRFLSFEDLFKNYFAAV